MTLNSDDPAFFGSDVAGEYLLAHTEQGFTRDELRQLAVNSIERQFPSRNGQNEVIFPASDQLSDVL